MKIVRLTQPTLRAARFQQKCKVMDVVALSPMTLDAAVEQTLARCRAEDVTHYAPLDYRSLIPNWRGFIINNDGVAYALRDGSGHAAGIILGLKTKDMLTGEKLCCEFLWLVAPSARKSGAAVKLLDALEADAKAAGCVRIICGADQRHSPKAMERFYTRRGYEPRVYTYSKAI